MPATEGEIKLVARITAMEILVQQLICLACNRDLDEVEDYRERVMEDASVTSVKGFDPAASDLLAAELQARAVCRDRNIADLPIFVRGCCELHSQKQAQLCFLKGHAIRVPHVLS